MLNFSITIILGHHISFNPVLDGEHQTMMYFGEASTSSALQYIEMLYVWSPYYHLSLMR